MSPNTSKRDISGTTTLYRFYDENDDLIYVGIAANPGRRFEQHRAMKEWWVQSSHISLEHYDTREEALAAEREAIKTEKPLFNITHNRGALQLANAVVVWCEVCDEPVAPGTGYLTISNNDVDAHQAVMRAAGADKSSGFVNFAILMKGPDAAEWRGYHAGCDPNPDGNDYWFGAERFTTWHDVLTVTAHLMGKNWLDNTNWDDVLVNLTLNRGPLRSP